jgi:hypothetical protein
MNIYLNLFFFFRSVKCKFFYFYISGCRLISFKVYLDTALQLQPHVPNMLKLGNIDEDYFYFILGMPIFYNILSGKFGSCTKGGIGFIYSGRLILGWWI